MITLHDLLETPALSRLFTQDQTKNCALQLWLAIFKEEKQISYRMLYGRLVPYSFSANSWSGTDDDKYVSVDGASVQVAQATLYFSSSKAVTLITLLSQGKTIEAVSAELQLGLTEKLAKKFGGATIGSKFHMRPASYLINRDARSRAGLRSPHGSSGAFSASLCSQDKLALFDIDGKASPELAEQLIRQLNGDTGLDFGGIDNSRFGELEMLVFPTLDDEDRELLESTWKSEPVRISV